MRARWRRWRVYRREYARLFGEAQDASNRVSAGAEKLIRAQARKAAGY